MQFNNQHDYTNLMPAASFNTAANAYFYQEHPVSGAPAAVAAPLLLEPYDHMVPSSAAAAAPPAVEAKNNDRGLAKDSDRKRPKRKQVKNACVNCQKACKKCDDGRPCQRCIKLGLTATCTNSPRKERKKGVKRGPYKKRQTAQQQQQQQQELMGTSTLHIATAADVYQQQPVNITPPLTTHTSPLSSSPLSTDLGYNYLAPSAHDAASSASAPSLSPVSPHFPQLAWDAAAAGGLWPAATDAATVVHHPDAPLDSAIITTPAFDPASYTNMVKSQQQAPPSAFDLYYPEDPCIMTSSEATWAVYSQQQHQHHQQHHQQQQQQQQQQFYEQQHHYQQPTGYWQTLLANA